MFGAPPDKIAFAAGPLEISWYGLLITIALAAAYVVAYILWKRQKAPPEAVRDFDRTVLIVLIAGVVGARALFVLYHLDYFINAPIEAIAFWRGGWVWHGGLIGGALALFFTVRRNAQKFFRFTDVFAPALALAQGVGRWGNYFNQEAYGLPTDAWWGIPIDLAHRVPGFEAATAFHPTFFYESIADVLLFVFLITLGLRKRQGHPGLITALYLVIYSVVRFGIEFLRIDSVPVFWGLRAPQWVSIAFFFWAGYYLLRRRKKLL